MKVLTFGVFDFFHYGHLKLFERAKALGDYLIVAVQQGEEITKTKPDANVMYTTEQRMEMVGAIRFVDQVIPYDQVDTTIQNVDFDIFAIGADQQHPGFQRAIAWCKASGKQVILLERTPNICSSNIKKQLNSK